MEVTLHSTTKTVELDNNGSIMPARVWEGHTADGIAVIAFITRIAVKHDADLTEFQRDLAEQRTPSADVQAWPNRMIL